MSSFAIVSEPEFEIRLNQTELEYLFMLMHNNMYKPKSAPLADLYDAIRDTMNITPNMEDEMFTRFKTYLSS